MSTRPPLARSIVLTFIDHEAPPEQPLPVHITHHALLDGDEIDLATPTPEVIDVRVNVDGQVVIRDRAASTWQVIGGGFRESVTRLTVPRRNLRVETEGDVLPERDHPTTYVLLRGRTREHNLLTPYDETLPNNGLPDVDGKGPDDPVDLYLFTAEVHIVQGTPLAKQKGRPDL